MLSEQLRVYFQASSEQAHSLKAAKKALSEQAFDVVISDFNLGDGTGVEIGHFLSASKSNAVLIYFSGADEIQAALAEVNFPHTVVQKPAFKEVLHLVEIVRLHRQNDRR